MNALDKALTALRHNPEDRRLQAEYYELILNGTFIVPVVEETAEDRIAAGRGADEVVPLVVQGEEGDCLILFDSHERLQQWAEREVPAISIPGHALARFSQAPLHWLLNAGSDYPKVFVPDEISALREAVERCDAEAAAKAAETLATKNGGEVPSATARHILVASEDECLKLMAEIRAGADFATVAMAQSQCPSRTKGGHLGTFSQGMMVAPFDRAVFDGEIGTLIGPVKTEFGYHLIEVLKRW